MTNKFNVGDRIRYVRQTSTNPIHHKYLGKEGTVLALPQLISGDKIKRYTITLVNTDIPRWFAREEELESVLPPESEEG